MTEQDKNLIIRLWESGEPTTAIVRLLPYDTQTAKSMVVELRQNGVLKGRSGKSKSKTWGKVLQAYNDGITNPYDLAEMFGLRVSTINDILSNSRLNRKRPKHNYKKRKEIDINSLCEKTTQIINEIKTGKPMSEIAKICGVARQYVYVIKNKYVKENRNVSK